MKRATHRSEIVDALSLEDLCRFCHADKAWVIELVEYGVLEPRGARIEAWQFRGPNIVRAKKARRLNRDLGINAAGVAMVIELLEERDQIRRRLSRYEPV